MRAYDSLSNQEREEVNDRILDRIKYTTESVHSSLSFAESKNAALLVLDFSLIWAFLPKAASPFYDKLVTVGFFIALLFACASFYPRIFSNPKRKLEDSQEVNLVFFRDLARLDGDQYLKRLYRLEGVDIQGAKTALPKVSVWLADSIVVNSSISIIKYNCFKFALSLTILLCIVKIVLLLFA